MRQKKVKRSVRYIRWSQEDLFKFLSEDAIACVLLRGKITGSPFIPWEFIPHTLQILEDHRGSTYPFVGSISPYIINISNGQHWTRAAWQNLILAPCFSYPESISGKKNRVNQCHGIPIF